MSDELKQTELNTEEKEVFLLQDENNNLGNDQESEKGRLRPQLNHKVLFSVFLGITAVFFLMMIINGVIFSHTLHQKTAYYLSILVSNTLFILVILGIKTGRRLSWADLGYKDKKFFKGIKGVFKVWGLTWLIHFAYMFILFEMGITPPGNALLELLLKPSLFFLIANIFLIAVAAPLIEETLFRGLLFGSMRPYLGTWTAIIISAAIFSALHFELLGFVPRFALGIGLGYLYVKYNSIYPSILLHALNNLLAVVIISAFS